FSYSPRYSQLSRQQLNYYLWWRQNVRSGIYMPTDASYIILFAYEIAASGDGEDRQSALDALCRVFAKCCGNDASLKMILRDIICDFSLIYDLTVSVDSFASADRRFFFGSSFNIPEAFIDFSEENILSICYAAAIYDYRRSKIFNEETATVFKQSIGGALRAIFKDEKAAQFITSFKNGLYNATTLEHRPLSRMVNIVNKSVKLEIEYYSLDTIQDIVTNAVRYSENRLREHLGVKNKLNILYLNPAVKDAIDKFFDENFPSKPFIDRRRREAKQQLQKNEVNEYDKLYDLPRVEFSPERALKIEEESWETTRKLEAAFGDSSNNVPEKNIDTLITNDEVKHLTENIVEEISVASDSNSSIAEEIYKRIPQAVDFLRLCFSPSLAEQRKFASEIGKSPDELADLINETSLDIMSDILLEEDGDGYFIIDDYKDLFN
ncbi:MAG: TerB N-terminal domain-containing protein, partial [Clostridia bacterium]|nr:TerB N-terminal domain-containing protein [Clostridia bacterium]